MNHTFLLKFSLWSHSFLLSEIGIYQNLDIKGTFYDITLSHKL